MKVGEVTAGIPRYTSPWEGLFPRYRELLKALRDPDVRIVWCSDGGAGALYLLPLLESVWQVDPWPTDKIIVGFSDPTALLYFFRKLGHPCWYGQNVTCENETDAHDLAATIAMIQGKLPYSNLQGERGVRVHAPVDVLHAGEVTGRLLPGCFSLHASLRGTPWQPDYSGAVLALEEHGPDTPGQHEYLFWEKLAPFEASGAWRDVRALLWGEIQRQGPYAEPEDVFLSVEGILEASWQYINGQEPVNAPRPSPLGALGCPWGNKSLPYALPVDAPVNVSVSDSGWLTMDIIVPETWLVLRR